MLAFSPHKHKLFLAIITLILLIFSGSLGALYYYSNQTIAKQQAEVQNQLSQLDRQIEDIKEQKETERKAKEEAERKEREAARKKAEAVAILKKQLQGQVVTPKACAISGPHGDPNSIDVVINKKRCFSPIDFVPNDLVSYQGFVISAKILPHLDAMFQAAAAAGIPLSITSSYRSYRNQVATYNHWVQVNGSYEAADRVSARPGYSEHQTGFTIDLSAGGCSLECFKDTSQYKWLKKNAHTFGFIERYPVGYEKITGYSPEAWHWRYVGKEVATDMKTKGVQTLEEYWDIKGGNYY